MGWVVDGGRGGGRGERVGRGGRGGGGGGVGSGRGGSGKGGMGERWCRRGARWSVTRKPQVSMYDPRLRLFDRP